MGYLALYRKYRPNTFEGLIGQDQVVKTLVNPPLAAEREPVFIVSL